MGEYECEPHEVSSTADLTPTIEKLRLGFHDIATPQLVPDKTFAGPGTAFAFQADLEETVRDAIESAESEEDDFDTTVELNAFSQLAGGTDHSLVGFDVSYAWGYGMDAARVLDRGYLYLPGNVDIPWRFIGAWEPAESREAFEHAFITNYVVCATEPEYNLPFEPIGDTGAAIVEVSVAPQLLAEAMKSSLEVEADAWGNVWAAIAASSMPAAERVAEILDVPEAAASIVIRAIREDDSAFRETIAEAPDDDRRAVLCVYLHAMGVLRDGADQGTDP